MGKKKSGETSKADMVRAALKDGIDNPEDGVAFIKQKFGIDMPRPTFSSYKSQERARQERNAGSEGAAKGRPGRKPRAAASVVAHASNGVPNMALQIEALKTLCDSLGVDQVISIAQLFRK